MQEQQLRTSQNDTITLKFSREIPRKEGRYLLRSGVCDYHIITVRRIPEDYSFGIRIPEYLAIMEWEKKHVESCINTQIFEIAELPELP